MADPSASDLDDETTAALTLFNEYVAADRERERKARRVKKAERAKDEAAAAIKRLEDKGGSAEDKAAAETTYRESLAAWQRLRDGEEPEEQRADEAETEPADEVAESGEAEAGESTESKAEESKADEPKADDTAPDEPADQDEADSPDPAANAEADDAEAESADSVATDRPVDEPTPDE